jgi:GNAT superfamily N-acetyltransferase
VDRSAEIRPLRREDDRTTFRSGHPALDRFFHHYAGQNQFKLHLGVTYVAIAADRIVGYATVTAGSLEREALPAPKLRRRMPGYPLPIVRLARLAVDERARGAGLGAALLRRVLLLSLEQRDALGCVGVVADAKPEAVAFYERFGFVCLEARQGGLPGDPSPMFLGIETIAATLRA